MRKLDLSPYPVQNGEKMGVYNCRQVCEAVLFSQQLGLTGKRLAEHMDIWKKVESCLDNNLLLEDAEFAVLERAFDGVQDFGKGDYEFYMRVKNAPKVNQVAEVTDGQS